MPLISGLRSPVILKVRRHIPALVNAGIPAWGLPAVRLRTDEPVLSFSEQLPTSLQPPTRSSFHSFTEEPGSLSPLLTLFACAAFVQRPAPSSVRSHLSSIPVHDQHPEAPYPLVLPLLPTLRPTSRPLFVNFISTTAKRSRRAIS